jgi:hypothetical protein
VFFKTRVCRTCIYASIPKEEKEDDFRGGLV